MRLVILFLFVLLSGIVRAQTVNKETAEIVARNFYMERLKMYSPQSISAIEFKKEKLLKSNSLDYYILNLEDNKGFVIVSGSQKTIPVLAYALSGGFNQNDMPPVVKDWMEGIELQIKNGSNLKSSESNKIKLEWEKYTNLDFENYLNTQIKLKGGTTSVSPLLSTNWNQGQYYNTLCPVCPSGGSGGHVWTGCVATAQAQVMKYHNYPSQGIGQHSYNHWVYGLQSANFGETTYNWASMPASISSNNSNVATLMYHCGVSVDMNYSPTGSGASGSSTRNALVNYF
jgi:hypothetical protein